jgi:uncharacterized protein YyaL (SSP411 family)
VKGKGSYLTANSQYFSVDPRLARLYHFRHSLPGAKPHSVKLGQRLLKAFDKRGKKYKPRTHHFLKNGEPTYMNRLMLETSPYLLQHAHNPVNWYPWGKEAFARAKRENKPVLLSVGYSTCHWCHVMERESFEDPKTAAYMNKHYIAIKVDREERTDVDGIYMSAVQLFAGSGGWPMTVWLTPDRKPFYGGTYFPPKSRWGRRSFMQMLRLMRQRFRTNRRGITSKANSVIRRLRAWARVPAVSGVPSSQQLLATARIFTRNFDAQNGGRRGRPKFPSSWSPAFMLRYYRRTGDKKALQMALSTLRKMGRGGIYDQVGGGFHRYATDRRWLVPHFEKMLYDNALLVPAYLDAWQLTKDPEMARIAKETLDYVKREMTAPNGGFYSATDADSEGHEGKFFVWTPAQIKRIVGAKLAQWVFAYYNVTKRGNFEGKNILNVTRSAAVVARRLKVPEATFWAGIQQARQLLYKARQKRIPPLCDTKIITAWNGLMISAFARGGLVLNRADYVQQAARAARFLLKKVRRKGRLYRTFKDGRAKHNAYLEDYAFLIAGLLDLHEATRQKSWFKEALALQNTLDRLFRDARRGGYYRTSRDHETLLMRPKPRYDGAVPTGNSIAAMNLQRFYELTTQSAFRLKAERLFKAFGRRLNRWPVALSEMMLALDFYHDAPKEIVLIKPSANADISAFLTKLRSLYLPNRVLLVTTQGRQQLREQRTFPLLKSKVARKGKVTAYVCMQQTCELPTTSPSVFAKQLQKTKKLKFPGL